MSHLSPQQALCFESSEAAEIYGKLYPEDQERVFSQRALVDLLSPQASAVAPPEAVTPQMIALAEELTAALVITPQDLDFAFSQIPHTPKNAQLHQAVRRYYESEARQQTESTRVWNTVTQLKAQSITLPFSITFVRHFETTSLFGELATAFQASTPVAIQEPWEWAGKRRENEAAPVQYGSSHALLVNLARRIQRQLKHTEEVELFFGGSRPERLFLTASFLARGISERVSFFAPHLMPASQHKVRYGFLSGEFEWFEHPERLLTSDEREAMRQAGILISSPSHTMERLKHYFYGVRNNTVGLFVNEKLPEELLPAIRRARRRTPLEAAPARQYHVPLPPASLSATQLETFAQCPSRYLLSQKLRLNRFSIACESSFAAQFGKAVHSTLETFFTPPQRDVTTTALREEFEKSLAELAPELEPGNLMPVLFRELFRPMAERIPALEKQMSAILGPHQPESLELAFKVDVNGVTVRGKIDRVERTASGECLVLDYKTGNVTFTPEHMRRGENYQALLYLLALQERERKFPIGILFYDLKQGELKRGFIREEALSSEAKKLLTRGHAMPSEKFESTIAEGVEHMHRLAANIAGGDFTPTPSAEACGFCDFSLHCRRAHGSH